jgi:predicted ArsR family transcriptional regulator
MGTEERIRLSPQSLRGIAHPLRLRLLTLLREEGPSTATRLAGSTGQSSGATSYHLRQLAAYGFVVEDDTRTGTGRERWWRAAHRGSTLEAEDARQAPAETEAYLRAVATLYADRMDRWLGEIPTLPSAWDRGGTLSDYRLRLTAPEAARLLEELEAVVAGFRKDDPEVEAPEGAEPVVLQLQQMPFLRGAS